jgi:hypothetical protein
LAHAQVAARYAGHRLVALMDLNLATAEDGA